MSLPFRAAMMSLVLLSFLSYVAGCQRYQARLSDEADLSEKPLPPVTKATSQPTACMSVERRYRRSFAFFRKHTQFDVDNDGTPNMVVNEYGEGLIITDRLGRKIECVALGRRFSSLMIDVQPINLEGRTQWAAVSMDFDLDQTENHERHTVLALYDRKGELRWQFRLESPAGFSNDENLKIITSNLRSPHDSELIVGWNYTRKFDPDRDWSATADEKEPAQLLVLDATSGNVLCQRRIEAEIEHLDWTPATDADPPMIIYGADSELVTLRIDGLQSPN